MLAIPDSVILFLQEWLVLLWLFKRNTLKGRAGNYWSVSSTCQSSMYPLASSGMMLVSVFRGSNP